ncbi:MAG TPA: hypothetical protein VIJ14_03800, partial [Rhabdochlamydiaceae bacterium]
MIEITEQIVRDVLRFGDVGEERTEFPMFLIRGCFLRMGYNGDINAAMMKKTHLPSTWRFLMHIIIVCLSNRKAGFDVLSHATQSAMTALVLNKPFNFSGLIFSYMKANIASRIKFLLYPRFIQLILDAVAPNLPKIGRRFPIIRMQKRIFADCKQFGRLAKPVDVPLFGHIINPGYIEPAQDNWVNPDEVFPAAQPAQHAPPAPVPNVQGEAVAEEPVVVEEVFEEVVVEEVVEEVGVEPVVDPVDDLMNEIPGDFGAPEFDDALDLDFSASDSEPARTEREQAAIDRLRGTAQAGTSSRSRPKRKVPRRNLYDSDSDYVPE